MAARKQLVSPSAFAWTASFLVHACAGVACYFTAGGYAPPLRLGQAEPLPTLRIALVSAAEAPSAFPPSAKDAEPPLPEAPAIHVPPAEAPPERPPIAPQDAADEPRAPVAPEECVAWAPPSVSPPEMRLEFPPPAAPAPAPPPPAPASAPPAPEVPREPKPKRGDDLATAVAPVRRAENPPPSYPWLARCRGYEGLVLLAIRVSGAGRPTSVEVKQSSGYASLDEAAVAAAWKWRFEPAMLNGTPIEAEVDVPIRFKLTD